MGDKWEIPPDEAGVELEKILTFDLVDDYSFMRGNACLRALGVPVSNAGKPAVIPFQSGVEARNRWEAYEFERELLAEKHENWKETQDFD